MRHGFSRPQSASTRQALCPGRMGRWITGLHTRNRWIVPSLPFGFGVAELAGSKRGNIRRFQGVQTPVPPRRFSPPVSSLLRHGFGRLACMDTETGDLFESQLDRLKEFTYNLGTEHEVDDED